VELSGHRIRRAASTDLPALHELDPWCDARIEVDILERSVAG